MQTFNKKEWYSYNKMRFELNYFKLRERLDDCSNKLFIYYQLFVNLPVGQN